MTTTRYPILRLIYFLSLSFLAARLAAQEPTNSLPPPTVSAPAYDQIILEGNARFKAGDYAGAHDDAIKALALDGNRFEGYALESLVSFKEGHTTEAKTFMDLALEKVPASKKPQLEALAATIERVGSPAAAPSAEVSTATQSRPAEIDQLRDDDRLEYETLLAMLSDADKASDLDSRHKMLGDFMDKSAGFLKAHPDLVHLWVARAAVAVELDRGEEGWEAGQKLKALGLENSTDPEIVKVMVELNEKGWLSKERPKLSRRDAVKIAGEPVVVLKNDNLLPLNPARIKKITLVAIADNSNGAAARIFEGIKQRTGGNIEVRYAHDESEAVTDAKSSDVVVFADSSSDDKSSFALLARLYKAGGPVVVVHSKNRTNISEWTWEMRSVPAILQIRHPSEENEDALLDILFGNIDSGGTPPNLLSNSHNQKVSYEHCSLDNSVVPPNGTVSVSFDVKNPGRNDEDGVAEIYFRHSTWIGLCGFQRIHLAEGASKRIKMEIPVEEISTDDDTANKNVVDAGKYQLLIGPALDDIRWRLPLVITSE